MFQIDSVQFEKILKYIRSGIESGATLESGGERIGSKGYYIQPTVFSNVQALYLQKYFYFWTSSNTKTEVNNQNDLLFIIAG